MTGGTVASEKVAIQFSNPNVANLGAHIESSAARKLPLVARNRHADAPGAVIAGLATSLKNFDTLAAIEERARQGWTVFGIKEAISYLTERGVDVTYGANMDPGAQEAERVPIVPGVTYCVASSCHPALFDHLLGADAAVEVYHSACGWPNETFLYRRLFGTGATMIGGFTVANRTIGLAHYMGFPKILLAGCDFGWRDGGAYYASVVAAEPIRDIVLNDRGRVDGTAWHARPDLIASAVAVARLIKTGQVEVVGDSLAASLATHDDAFLDEVASVRKPNGMTTKL